MAAPPPTTLKSQGGVGQILKGTGYALIRLPNLAMLRMMMLRVMMIMSYDDDNSADDAAAGDDDDVEAAADYARS